MATVLIRTQAGQAHDHAVRMGQQAASPISAIVCDSGAVITDVPAIKDLTRVGRVAYTIDNTAWAITEAAESYTRFEALIPETVTGLQINGIGLLLENGLLWGYAPYLPERSGLLMDGSFSWTLDLIIAESDSATLELRYSPFDVREIRERLMAQLLAEMRVALLCHGFRSPPLGEQADCSQAVTGLNPSITGIAAPDF